MPVSVFSLQMEVLAQLRYSTLRLDEFAKWRQQRLCGAHRVLITFDDGFADFADSAHPILQQYGFTSVVFLPTGRVGGSESWEHASRPPRRLMTWRQVKELAAAGVEFGAHSVSHADLTKLSACRRREEILRSGEELENQLGSPVRSFAPPYGRTNAEVRLDVSQRYDLAFGTRLAFAELMDDPLEMPRIEMHYFRSPKTWRKLLEGKTAYLRTRAVLRRGKAAAVQLLRSCS